MQLVRRHLRRFVSVWLVCHVLTFSALVPRDCCAAHAHQSHGTAATSAEAPCHEAATAEHASGSHCPMPADAGAACPMHTAGATPSDCRMTGVCNAPAAALAAVLMSAAVPATPFTLTPHTFASADRVAAHVHPLSQYPPIDSPPPRL